MKKELFSLHEDLEDRHWWFVGRRRVLDPLIRAAMQKVERDLVIDMGCGTGGTVAALSRDFECLGIDHSTEAIAIAKTKYPACNFYCDDAGEVLVRSTPRTALYLLMDVIEHVEDDRRFLADVTSIARPGSHILITVPAKPALWSVHDVTSGHKRRYEMDTLADLWQGLPVRPRVLSYFNTRLYPIIWFARIVGRRLGLFKGEQGSDLSIPSEFVNRLLTKIFSGERYRMERLLADASATPFATGVSLVALLQRTDGTVRI
ncbi:MAG: methyltransferase domain-containing protein [Rhodospirillales bacterium]|nr:methyltransferase domain-containing protein [Rhodospirillales bacterium]